MADFRRARQVLLSSDFFNGVHDEHLEGRLSVSSHRSGSICATTLRRYLLIPLVHLNQYSFDNQ